MDRPLVAAKECFISPLSEPQLFDIQLHANEFKSMSCLCMAAFGWRKTMNECACNSTSPQNGKDSLLYRSGSDSSLGGGYDSADRGSG